MAGAMYGFVRQPQQRSMDPAEVGMRLMQRAQEPPAPPESPPVGEPAPLVNPKVMEDGEFGPSLEDRSSMQQIAAQLMGGGLGIPERALQDHDDPATAQAVGEMLSHLGAGGNPNRVNLVKSDRNPALLRKHGLSDTEVELLSRSGVI